MEFHLTEPHIRFKKNQRSFRNKKNEQKKMNKPSIVSVSIPKISASRAVRCLFFVPHDLLQFLKIQFLIQFIQL